MTSKPGERALLAMKEMDKPVTFKKPSTPLVKKKISKPKYEIISEEEYIENLSKIIQRDYFPDLEKLKIQNEYLDALASNDYIKIRQIFKRYQIKTPLPGRIPSPATFDTPLVTGQCDEPQSSQRSRRSTASSTSSNKSVTARHTVDSYLDTYTSEDNQSFQEIIEAADKKLRQKYAVLFNAEESSKEQMEKSLALPSISDQFQLEPSKNVETWTYKNQNALMYNPDGWQLTKAEQIEMAKLRQEISRRNTRLSKNPFADQKSAIGDAIKAQAKFAGNKVGVDGKEISNDDMPQVGGFSFVATPSPMPGVAESPLMTWGEIEGTPFRLDGGDTPLHPSIGPSFRITETSKRENIALQLAGAAAEKQRAKKAKAIEAAKRNIAASPRVRSSFDRLASMSPAARRLATVKLGISTTPSPAWTPSSTPLGSKKPMQSPLVRKRTPAQRGDATPNLTDNLLDLPSSSKRTKAADFF